MSFLYASYKYSFLAFNISHEGICQEQSKIIILGLFKLFSNQFVLTKFFISFYLFIVDLLKILRHNL